jgi:hypothetical protein
VRHACPTQRRIHNCATTTNQMAHPYVPFPPPHTRHPQTHTHTHTHEQTPEQTPRIPVRVEEGVVVADGIEAEPHVVGGQGSVGIVPGEVLHRPLLPLDLLLDLLCFGGGGGVGGRCSGVYNKRTGTDINNHHKGVSIPPTPPPPPPPPPTTRKSPLADRRSACLPDCLSE